MTKKRVVSAPGWLVVKVMFSDHLLPSPTR